MVWCEWRLPENTGSLGDNIVDGWDGGGGGGRHEPPALLLDGPLQRHLQKIFSCKETNGQNIHLEPVCRVARYVVDPDPHGCTSN